MAASLVDLAGFWMVGNWTLTVSKACSGCHAAQIGGAGGCVLCRCWLLAALHYL
jgi:hypothetical protein